MLIGIRTAILVLVPASFVLTSGVVDAWWWHTAQSNGRMEPRSFRVLISALDFDLPREVARHRHANAGGVGPHQPGRP